MARKEKPLKIRGLLKLAEFAQPYLENAIEIMKKIAERAADHCFPPQAGISQARENLFCIRKEYGPEILAKVMVYIVENSIGTYELSNVKTVAQAFKDNRVEVLNKTLELMEKFRIFWDMWVVYNGLLKFGENELLEATFLVARPPDEAEGIVRQEFWNPEKVWLERKGEYICIAAKLGIERLRELHAIFTNEGLTYQYTCAFLGAISPSFYEYPGIDSYRKKAERIIFQSLEMIKAHGLEPSKLAYAVYYTLLMHRASRAEVEEILKLMKRYEIDYISQQDLEIAVRYYREPSNRWIVIECFEKKSVSSLSWVSIGEGLTIGFSMTNMGPGVEAVERSLAASARRESRLRTQELLQEKYLEIGIPTFLQELIPDYVDNPLITAAVVFSKSKWLRRPHDIIEKARKNFGRDAISEVLKIFDEGYENEVILALLIHGNPGEFLKILRQISRLERLPFVRAINSQGPKIALKTIAIVRGLNLDPSYFMENVAFSLAAKDGEIKIIGAQLSKVISPENETQLRYFLELPVDTRKNIAVAIRLYRKMYDDIYCRIAYDYVR